MLQHSNRRHPGHQHVTECPCAKKTAIVDRTMRSGMAAVLPARYAQSIAPDRGSAPQNFNRDLMEMTSCQGNA